MRCATAILVIAILAGVAAVARAQAAQSAVGTSKINAKDGLTYVWIPPATFRMGCTAESRECLGQELPRHSVTLTKGYWIGQTLVTHAAYKKVIGASGANSGDDQLPMDTADWNAAKERFHLSFHRTSKDFPVYELTIAKGGPKLKENSDPNLKPLRPGDWDPRSLDRDGYPILPEGIAGSTGHVVNGVMRSTYRGMSLSSLISRIGMELGTAIPGSMYAAARTIDKTGLNGEYDFHLETTAGAGKIGGALRQTPSADPQDPNGGPTLFEALERQLGLRLEQKKAPFDVLVIDRADKIPAENQGAAPPGSGSRCGAPLAVAFSAT